jgi:hypothetical protein
MEDLETKKKNEIQLYENTIANLHKQAKEQDEKIIGLQSETMQI